MASDNLTMPQFDQWQFKPTFNNTYENECLTNALYKSYTNTATFDNSSNDNVFTDLVDSIIYNQPPPPPPTVQTQTPLTSTISAASENDVPAPLKRRRTGPPTAKASKRKSRASKRSMTTFITADPANFRQMVQEVTGVRVNGEASAFKPEPQMMFQHQQQQQQQPGFDTSSFLLDSPFPVNGGYYDHEMPQPTITRGGNGAGAGGGGGYGFDSFCNFPTLESWKV